MPQNSPAVSAPSLDEAAVESVIRAVGLLADRREFEPLADLFADQTRLDYTSLAGGAPETLSGPEIMDRWAALLPGFDRTRHDLSDIRVQVSGDTATASAHVVADHWLGDDWWRVEGDYAYALTRVDGEWRITALTLTATGQAGDPAIAERAGAVAQAHPSSWVRRQKARQVVMDFLTGLEDKDMDRVNAVWAEDGVQEMPHRPSGWPLRVEGRDALIRQYAEWPNTAGRARFTDELVFHPTTDPDTVVMEYRGVVEVLPTGRTYDQRYVGIITVKDGRIQLFKEYFNPALFAEAFGVAP